MSKSRAVVISPTYNENPNIKKLIPVLADVFGKIKDWEMVLLVVDDSSPDGTADAVRELQKKYPFVHLLVNKKKQGLGGAYLKGMAKAFDEMDADVVFELDADLSHDPKKIPAFLAEIEKGADLVLGSRYIKGGSIPSNWGLRRKFLSVVGNWVVSIILTSRAVHDWTTGYRAIRRSVYESVKGVIGSERFFGYTFQIGFLHQTLRAGFKVTEVPFHFIDREFGESKMGPEYLINPLKYLFQVRYQEITSSRIFKFLVVGSIGFAVNFVAYQVFNLFRLWTGLQNLLGLTDTAGWLSFVASDQGLAVVLGAECAIVSNYLLNNVWTFGDRRIHGWKHLRKFGEFNAGSIGSVVIQYLTMQASILALGIFTVLQLGPWSVQSDSLYLAAGVLLGMIWNFAVYSLVIWRK
jgi:dolichol-phosphate mannosyltransferase